MSDKEREDALVEERRLAIMEGNWIEHLEQSEGWELIKREFIDKGLSRKRFLGTRAGKLMWIQGFQAALDGLEEFMKHKKAVRDQILIEEYNTSAGESRRF